MNYSRPHHRAIGDILQKFDADFLEDHNILFGEGTRISLELGEYRESIDIDFFCVGRAAYRAARSSVTDKEFGSLLQAGQKLDLYQRRTIRADRDAIRAFMDAPGRPIKLEIIHFEDGLIQADLRRELFPVPFVGIHGCFSTKLTANADRNSDIHRKDILDLCMMRREWGNIPAPAWQSACEQYGEQVIQNGLINALQQITQKPSAVISAAAETLKINPTLADELVNQTACHWLSELTSTTA